MASPRQDPGSPSGSNRGSPRSARLIDGITTDDDYFQRKNWHMAPVDYGLQNINKAADYEEKYRKISERGKLMFRALIRRAVRNARETGPAGMSRASLAALPAPHDIAKPLVQDYGSLPDIIPEDREVYRGRLSRLLIVKIATFTKESFETEFLTVIQQLKVLNELYSTEIPLLLVSNFYNNAFIEKVAHKYSDNKLTIYVVKQPLFPLVSRFAQDPKDVFNPKESADLKGKNEEYAPSSSGTRASQPLQYYFSIATMKIKKEDLGLPPFQLHRTDWYNPGVVFTLLEQVKCHSAANEKEHVLLLNSENLENVVDIRILNYLCQAQGPKIDVCFEVLKHRESDLSAGCDFLVNCGERLRIVPRTFLEENGYNVTDDGFILTNNMWINLQFLRNEESDAILLKLVSMKELKFNDNSTVISLEMTLPALMKSQDPRCTAVEVPPLRIVRGGFFWKMMNPSWCKKHKLKMLFTYVLFSVCYHGPLYFMTAALDEWYVKRDKSKADRDGGIQFQELKAQDRELNIFWIENAIWLLLVYIYFSILTYRRKKMAHRSRSPQQRVTSICADGYQAVLLGTTRFLYAGLSKTAATKEWFGGNAWWYLLLIHFLSSVLEIVGSFLIMRFVDAPNVMEPIETA